MELNYDESLLRDYLQSFYRLTHMRVVLFDRDGKKLCAFPEEDCPFCRLIQTQHGLGSACESSNRDFFAQCRKSGKLCLHYCHASLIEAASPLRGKQGEILGYAMIGQCAPIKDKAKRFEEMKKNLGERGVDISSDRQEVDRLIHKSKEQFASAAKILEALVQYLVYQNWIRLGKSPFKKELDAYLESHIVEAVPISDLCRHFGVCRTRLYEVASTSLSMSLGQYISSFRLQKAKQMLLEPSSRPVDVAYRLGYVDEAYFCKVFKQHVGMTPGQYKKKNL